MSYVAPLIGIAALMVFTAMFLVPKRKPNKEEADAGLTTGGGDAPPPRRIEQYSDGSEGSGGDGGGE
jgi:hypothetical protein